MRVPPWFALESAYDQTPLAQRICGRSITHIGIGDQAKAVANLPTPKSASKGRPEPASPAAQQNGRALQMRCRFCSAESHSLSSAGSEDQVQKRHNPCRSKGYDADRRQLALADKSGGGGNRTRRPTATRHCKVRCFMNSRMAWQRIGSG